MMSNLLTVSQSAQIAGVTRSAINQAITAGRLTAIRPGRDYLIDESDLLAYLASRTVVKQGDHIGMYTTDAIPNHWIISDTDGWHLVANTPGGWATRKPYRGDVVGLVPVVPGVAAGMARIVGYGAQ